MSGKNPFKKIEEENVRKFNERGPRTPIFLNTTDNNPKLYPPTNTSGSPSFPSFS